MAKRTLADVTRIREPSDSVLAAPWPYFLAGFIILVIAGWSALGGSTEAAQSEEARNQARQTVGSLGRVVQEIQEMLRSDAFQEQAQAVQAGEAITSSLLAQARRMIPEVTDVHLYDSGVFMTDLDAIGDNGFIMLDMMSAALEDELSPVQFIQDEGLSYVAAATTIGRAVQGKGFVVVYLDPSYLLNLFSVAEPAAGYLGLEHAAGANAPLSLKAIGSEMPSGYTATRLKVPSSLLQVVFPEQRGSMLIGVKQQLVLLILGALLVLFGIARHFALKKAAAGVETMPERFVTVREGDTLRDTTPPTLAGARQERALRPPKPAPGKTRPTEPTTRSPATRPPDFEDIPSPLTSVSGSTPGSGRKPGEPEDPPIVRRDPPQAPRIARPAQEPEDPPLVPRISRPAQEPEDPPLVPRISQPAPTEGDELPPFIPSSSKPGPADAPPQEPVAETRTADSPPAPSTIPSTGVPLSSEIFRAYDIRGVVGKTLDRGIAMMIGRAVGSLAQDSLAGPLVVGRDGRHSGPDLVDGLIDGISASGCDVIDVGAVPTGALYFAAYELAKGSGVMVTGSHNPPDYNGFKIMIGGKTLSGNDIFGLFERLRTGNLRQGKGEVSGEDVLGAYRDRIAGDIQLARPLKVVADAGNGIGGICATEILRAIGAEVIPLYDEVDGDFPNHHPDPSEPENLRDLIESVRLTGADLGVAFDGDADRLGVVTPNGEIVFSDRIMMLYAREVLSRHPGETIIYDVKCTGHLDTVIREAGGVPEMYKTGHSLIKNRMKEVDAPFAGEMSGHFFFKDRWYGFDCGIYSACRLLEILAASPDSPADVLAALPNSVSTPELKVQLQEGENHAFIERFQKEAAFSDARINTIDGVRADWPDGWGLVRASNTTPILVLRFDADSKEALQRIQEDFRTQLLALKPDMKLPF